MLISRALVVRGELLVFVWRSPRFNIGISHCSTEEGLSPKRLSIFSFFDTEGAFLWGDLDQDQ